VDGVGLVARAVSLESRWPSFAGAGVQRWRRRRRYGCLPFTSAPLDRSGRARVCGRHCSMGKLGSYARPALHLYSIWRCTEGAHNHEQLAAPIGAHIGGRVGLLTDSEMNINILPFDLLLSNLLLFLHLLLNESIYRTRSIMTVTSTPSDVTTTAHPSISK
jgi:hypothetical protein